jgi:signal transduction histidine kinase
MFDLPAAMREATRSYSAEAARRNIQFELDVSTCPRYVVGDSKKICTVVQNLTGNARKCYIKKFDSPTDL